MCYNSYFPLEIHTWTNNKLYRIRIILSCSLINIFLLLHRNFVITTTTSRRRALVQIRHYSPLFFSLSYNSCNFINFLLHSLFIFLYLKFIIVVWDRIRFSSSVLSSFLVHSFVKYILLIASSTNDREILL